MKLKLQKNLRTTLEEEKTKLSVKTSHVDCFEREHQQ